MADLCGSEQAEALDSDVGVRQYDDAGREVDLRLPEDPFVQLTLQIEARAAELDAVAVAAGKRAFERVVDVDGREVGLQAAADGELRAAVVAFEGEHVAVGDVPVVGSRRDRSTGLLRFLRLELCVPLWVDRSLLPQDVEDLLAETLVAIVAQVFVGGGRESRRDDEREQCGECEAASGSRVCHRRRRLAKRSALGSSAGAVCPGRLRSIEGAILRDDA